MAKREAAPIDVLLQTIDVVGHVAFGSATIELFGLVIELFRKKRDAKETPVSAEDAVAALDVSAASLREALATIDTLKRSAEAEQSRLLRLADEASRTKLEVESILKDHALAQDLRNKDQEALRRTLGLADLERAIRKGKLSGFIAGVLASLLAALLYSGAATLYSTLRNTPLQPTPVPGQAQPK